MENNWAVFLATTLYFRLRKAFFLMPLVLPPASLNLRLPTWFKLMTKLQSLLKSQLSHCNSRKSNHSQKYEMIQDKWQSPCINISCMNHEKSPPKEICKRTNLVPRDKFSSWNTLRFLAIITRVFLLKLGFSTEIENEHSKGSNYCKKNTPKFHSTKIIILILTSIFSIQKAKTLILCSKLLNVIVQSVEHPLAQKRN